MRQSFKRLMSSVLALVFVVAAFGVYFNLVQPKYNDIMSERGELASLTGSIDAQRSTLKTVGELVVKYEQSQDARDQISFALPTDPKASEALAQLNGIAMVHNLSAQAYALTIATNGPSGDKSRSQDKTKLETYPAKTVLFQVRLTGSYEDFQKYLENLQTNIRLFDVKTIGVAEAGKPDQNIYNFELRVAAYYQNEDPK